MRGFTTRAKIRATPESVWSLLSQAASYPRWNPEIVKIDGQIALGQKIAAHVNLGGGVIRRVTVRVTELEPPHRMVWIGGLPLGLFVGQRTFTLTPLESGLVEFVMELQFRGLFAAPIAKSLGNRQPDIDALAQALKKYAEEH